MSSSAAMTTQCAPDCSAPYCKRRNASCAALACSDTALISRDWCKYLRAAARSRCAAAMTPAR
jgi:hypothetical protein